MQTPRGSVFFLHISTVLTSLSGSYSRFCNDVIEGNRLMLAGDFMAYMYPIDEFNEEDIEEGLFREPLLLSVSNLRLSHGVLLHANSLIPLGRTAYIHRTFVCTQQAFRAIIGRSAVDRGCVGSEGSHARDDSVGRSYGT